MTNYPKVNQDLEIADGGGAASVQLKSTSSALQDVSIWVIPKVAGTYVATPTLNGVDRADLAVNVTAAIPTLIQLPGVFSDKAVPGIKVTNNTVGSGKKAVSVSIIARSTGPMVAQ